MLAIAHYIPSSRTEDESGAAAFEKERCRSESESAEPTGHDVYSMGNNFTIQ
jgi:hypothetical protein